MDDVTKIAMVNTLLAGLAPVAMLDKRAKELQEQASLAKSQAINQFIDQLTTMTSDADTEHVFPVATTGTANTYPVELKIPTQNGDA